MYKKQYTHTYIYIESQEFQRRACLSCRFEAITALVVEASRWRPPPAEWSAPAPSEAVLEATVLAGFLM